MAKWKVTPGTHGNTMTTQLEDLDIDRGTGDYMISQDISEILESTKEDREKESYFGKSKNGYRKAFTIPDVVAIEIKQKYGIDVFSHDFMHNPSDKAKVFAIVERDYPLLKSTEGRIG